jgi:hypothetical protein
MPRVAMLLKIGLTPLYRGHRLEDLWVSLRKLVSRLYISSTAANAVARMLSMSMCM